MAKAADPVNEKLEFRKEDLDAWHKLFREFDVNKDGFVDKVEFSMICDAAAKKRGDTPREDEWITRAFAEADKNGDGKIDFSEYVLITHKHKATIDPKYADNYSPLFRTEKDFAAKAAKHVTSVPVLRETLELAKKSKDPALVREAQRLLYALGDAGMPTLAGIVFDEGEEMITGKQKNRSVQAGNRYNLAALGEIGLNAAGNMVDQAIVRDQIIQQQTRLGSDDPAMLRSQRDMSAWTDVLAALPSSHDVETIFSYFQFTGLTNMLAIAYIEKFPSLGYDFDLPPAFGSWQLYLGWMNIFNIDLQAVATWVGNYDLPPAFETFSELPFASLYLLVTAVLPLAISFVTLLLFRPLYQVLWLFATVLSMALVFSCALAIGLVDEDRLAVVGGGTLTPEFLNSLLYTGVGLFAAMMLTFASRSWYLTHLELRAQRSKIEDNIKQGRTITLGYFAQQDAVKRDTGPPPALPWFTLLRNAAVTVITMFFATSDYWLRGMTVGKVLSIILGCVSIISIFYNALTYSAFGRVLLTKIALFANQWAVTTFLLLLSILYMPITRMLFAVWLSTRAECVKGERFPEFANELSSASAQWLASGVVQCEPCEFESFSHYSIPWSVKFVSAGECSAQFCKGEASVRSFQDPRLGYFETILPFFW
jgi:hypothetical protein